MGTTLRTIEYYRRLPYTLYREPLQDEDGEKYWTAEFVELRGCKTEGITEAEAISNLQELFDDYIATLLERDLEIPEPPKILSEVREIDAVILPKKMTHQEKNIITNESLKTDSEKPVEFEYAA